MTKVRVERLQEISEQDAIAEGYYGDGLTDEGRKWTPPVTWYRNAWDSLNAKRGFPWASNPWIFVIEFKPIRSRP